ncbi:hypothetical protein BDR04DRAFT_1156254 [Suillus decipiens]|nr:hypothetical protein BDR04DRAFT_1156254 [Suillus decipiens]
MIILLVHRDHPSIRFHRPLHHDSRTYCQRIDTTPARTDWITGEPPGWKVYNSAETNRRTYSSTCDLAVIEIEIAIDSDIYKLFISSIVPCTTTFVSTIGEEGI